MPRQSCWREFAQETSLAGFKYLLPEYGPGYRRVIWAVIVTAFTVITIYQLAQQFVGYVTTPLKVTVDRQYPLDLPFPTVVICNVMPWRVTAVRPRSDMHLAISARMPHNNATLSTISDVREYFEDVAFQKENLIVRCYFDRNETACNISRDFTTVVTPHGICYAFNTNATNPFRVTNAGTGLELVLNAETYEAMAGPYTTFGVQVSFNPVGTPLSTRFVNTLLGSYTSIGLTYHETAFFEGKTCQNKKLQFFETYTRAACEVEETWKKIISQCRCSPYQLPSTYINNDTVPAHCNLAKHFQCAESLIENPPVVNDEICPKQCHIYEYSVSVTQAAAAWDQIQAGQSRSRNLDDGIGDRLLAAKEMTQRYIPAKNHTVKDLFRSVEYAKDNVTSLRESVNALGLADCNLPPLAAGAPPPDAYSQAKLDQLTKQDVPGLRASILNSLNSLNATMTYLFENIVFNDTYQNLLDNRSTELDPRDLPRDNNLIDIKKGYVYLKSLSPWLLVLESLTKIDPTPKSATAAIGIGIGSTTSAAPAPAAAPVASTGASDVVTISKINASFYLPDGRTILHPNDTRLLNAAAETLKPLQLDYEKPHSCWNVPIPKPFVAANPEVEDFDIVAITPPAINESWAYPHGNPRVFDMITCLQIMYTSDGVLQTMAARLPAVVSIFADSDVDAEQQMAQCQQFLCEYLNTDVVPDNCTLTTDAWISAWNLSYVWLNGMLSNCEQTAQIGLEDLDMFVQHYADTVYPYYTTILNAVNDMLKHMVDIQAIFGTEIWKNDTHYDDLSNNMTGYIYGAINYKQFSKAMNEVFEPWATQTFLFDAGQVKNTLQKVLDEFKVAYDDLSLMSANYDLYGPAENENVSNPNGIMPVLETYVMQRKNATDVQIARQIARCALHIPNITQPLLDQITNLSQTYQRSIVKLNDDAKTFLESLNTASGFFEKNYMVLNVHFDEISVESTSEIESYEFWSLMADLGGASGLWLGFSVVTLIELIDLLFRHGFRCCSAPARRYRRKREAIKKAEREAIARRDVASLLALQKAREELESASKELDEYDAQQEAVQNATVEQVEQAMQTEEDSEQAAIDAELDKVAKEVTEREAAVNLINELVPSDPNGHSTANGVVHRDSVIATSTL